MRTTPRLLGVFGAAVLSVGACAFDYHGTPTAWGLLHADSGAAVQNRMNGGLLATSIDANIPRSSTSTFIACYAQIPGIGAADMRFASNKSLAEIDALRNSGWRILDVEALTSTRFSAVLVRSSKFPPVTQWFHGLTAAQVTTRIGTTNRLLELDSYLVGGQWRFSGVIVNNQGANGRPWGWMPNSTLAQIGDWANTNNMRVIDLDPRGSGRYSAVFVRRQAGERYYLISGRWADVWAFTEGTGSRVQVLNKLESQDFYAAILVNNVNAQNARIADTLAKYAGGFQFGAFVRQVGGPVLVDLRGNRDFYPASSIKVLIHAAGLAKVEQSQLDTYRVNGELLSSVASDMMLNSNNPDTYRLNSHFGTDYINGYGRSQLGTTTNTWIATHYGNTPPPGQLNANGRLVDLTNIYLNYRGKLGSGRSARFRAWMLNETNSSLFNNYVASLRTTAGLSVAQFNDWWSRVSWVYKGGNLGLTGSSTLNRYVCNIGELTLPFKSGPLILLRRYVFGWFVNDSISGYPGSRFKTDSAMLFREQLIASMQTFR